MASILKSNLTLWTDDEWIYIKAVSSVEFEYKELDVTWALRLIMKGPDTLGLYDRLEKTFETEPFTAFGFQMDLVPVVKVKKNEVGEDWLQGKISVELRLFPMESISNYSQGSFKMNRITLNKPDVVV